MKNLIMISRLIIYLLGCFFVLMAFDCFSGSDTFLNKFICFLISSLPGVGIIGATVLLKKKELILGIMIFVFAIIFFVLFKFYENTSSKLLIISIVMLPLVFTGTVFVISRNRFK